MRYHPENIGYWHLNPLDPIHCRILDAFVEGEVWPHKRNKFEVAYLIAEELIKVDVDTFETEVTAKGVEGLELFREA